MFSYHNNTLGEENESIYSKQFLCFTKQLVQIFFFYLRYVTLYATVTE